MRNEFKPRWLFLKLKFPFVSLFIMRFSKLPRKRVDLLDFTILYNLPTSFSCPGRVWKSKGNPNGFVGWTTSCWRPGKSNRNEITLLCFINSTMTRLINHKGVIISLISSRLGKLFVAVIRPYQPSNQNLSQIRLKNEFALNLCSLVGYFCPARTSAILPKTWLNFPRILF